jgi:hypothetical protein
LLIPPQAAAAESDEQRARQTAQLEEEKTRLRRNQVRNILLTEMQAEAHSGLQQASGEHEG